MHWDWHFQKSRTTVMPKAGSQALTFAWIHENPKLFFSQTTGDPWSPLSRWFPLTKWGKMRAITTRSFIVMGIQPRWLLGNWLMDVAQTQFSDTALGFQTGTRDVWFGLRNVSNKFWTESLYFASNLCEARFTLVQYKISLTQTVTSFCGLLLCIQASHAPKAWLYEHFREQTHTQPPWKAACVPECWKTL